MKCKDWSKDDSFSVGKQRLDGLEDVRNISLESCGAFLYQFKTSRARFLQISDEFPNSSDVEFSEDVTENHENISPVTQSNMCVLYNTSCVNGLPADERNSNSESETSFGDIIHSNLRRDYEVFKFVLGNEQFGVSI